METSHIILLVVSASISFAVGRVIMHMRKIKKNAQKELAAKKAAQALRDAPLGPESMNKSKRKRQALHIAKSGKNRV
jgi:mannitol-specific phosphotransferase system IIBC component